MFGQYSDCRSATSHYEHGIAQLLITLIDDDDYFAYCAVPLVVGVFNASFETVFLATDMTIERLLVHTYAR